VLVSEDRDIVSHILKGLSSNNIEIFEKSKIISINHAENKILFEIENKTTEVHFEELLVACGKEGNTNFISSNLNFDLDPKKFIVVNEHLETLKYRNIYACGDVNGLRQLTNAAAHQAWYTSVNALFGSWKKFSIEHDYIPHAVFIEPELARVGLNELDAKRKNIEYDLYHFDSSELDRNLIERNKLGKIKVLTIKNSDQILGVSIVGEAASEIIAEFVLAMKYKIGLNKILATSHIYPSFSEQNKYVAGVWKKRSVPEYLYKILKKYHQIVR
jgi:pyruvate/2-oxoglutarate dehydrogenase complex dihydrolipoamide dehydrogenase (E3) component